MGRAWPTRVYLLLLVAAVMLPLAALHGYVVYTHIASDASKARETVLRFAKLAASDTRHFLFDTEMTLKCVAERDEFQSLTPAGCHPLLKSFADANSDFTAARLVSSDGRVICAADGSPLSAGAARSWPGALPAELFRQKGLSISDLFINPANEHWSIALLYPVPNRADGEAAAVAMPVDLLDHNSVHYRTGLAGGTLPPGSTVTIVTEKGQILARWPDADVWVGRDAKTVPIVRHVLSNPQGYTESVGLDGTRKVYGFTSIAQSTWHLYIGVPSAYVAEPAQRFLLTNVFLIASAVLLIALMTMFFNRRLLRPMQRLADASRDAAGGDLSARVAVEGPAEIQSVTRQFNALLEARAAAEETLYRQKEQAEITLHSIGDAVLTTDAQFNVTYLNPVAEQLTGVPSVEAIGHNLFQVANLVNAVTRETVNKSIEATLEDGYVVSVAENTVLISRTGKEHHVADSAAPLRDQAGNLIGMVIVLRDVTKTRELEQTLSWQAWHDHLTGLINRFEFERRVEQALASARAESRHHVLLYLDLDQFKIVNDTCGHAAGDELLRRLVDVLQPQIRTDDPVARLGGDEFGLLLTDCPIDQALRIADQLRENVQDFRFAWRGRSFTIGVSIGALPITEASGTVAQVMHAADVACYAAKEKGRNRVHLLTPGDHEVSERLGEMQWIDRISTAFEEERFRLYAQPIVPVSDETGDAWSYEILIRMLDENGQVLTPGSFLPAAERYNLMPTIDRWVIRTLFCRLGEHTENELPGMFCINVSGHSLADDRFLDFIIEQFQQHQIAPKMICFEITESAAVANLTRAVHFITVLRAMGCRFALDDFGSGLSSFAYLKTFPVDLLKIDGSFVRQMGGDSFDHAIVKAINQLGHEAGLKTVGEFVETAEILAKLKTLAVDYAQGFGIHKPAPLERWLDNGGDSADT